MLAGDQRCRWKVGGRTVRTKLRGKPVSIAKISPVTITRRDREHIANQVDGLRQTEGSAIGENDLPLRVKDSIDNAVDCPAPAVAHIPQTHERLTG